MKKNPLIVLAIFTILILFQNCSKKDVTPAALVVDTTSVTIGKVSAYTDVISKAIALNRLGEGTITWEATIDNDWAELSKKFGTLTTKDSITVKVNNALLDYGANKATITLKPTINNVAGTAIKIPINLTNTAIRTLTNYTLTKSEEWRGRTYLTDVLEVPKGVTLTLGPGAEVIFESGNDYGIAVEGTFKVNGTKDKIVRLYSDNTSPTDEDWLGVICAGNSTDIKYCSISDANLGLYLYENYTGTCNLENVLLTNCVSGLLDNSGISTVSVKNSTILENTFGYLNWGSNKTIYAENIVFQGNSAALFYGSFDEVDSKATKINISSSNFLNNEDDLYNDDIFYPAYNTTVKVSGCYGLDNDSYTLDNSVYVSITNVVKNQISNIGCGFKLLRNARNKPNFSKQRVTDNLNKIQAKIKAKHK